jgi:hypothetical protein
MSYRKLKGIFLLALSSIFILISQSQFNVFAQNEDQIKILAQFVPDESEYTDNTYTINKFEMSVTNNSQICPSNNCKFQFTEGELRQNTVSSNLYPMTGILRVGTQEDPETMRYKVYDTNVNFKIFETLEKPNEIIHFVDGTINIGDSSNSKFEYKIINASLTIADSGDVVLDLIAQGANAYSESNNKDGSQNIETNSYFSIEPADNWIYETYSNFYMTDVLGFGPVNSIMLYPNEFSNDSLDKEEGEKIGVISNFVQDTRYPIKKAPLTEYVKYKNEENTVVKITLQENTTIDGQEAIKIYANGTGSYSTVKYIFYYVIYDNQPYYIAYIADIQNFSKYLPEFEKMLKSFKFVR